MRFSASCSRTTASAPARTTRENIAPLSLVVSSVVSVISLGFLPLPSHPCATQGRR